MSYLFLIPYVIIGVAIVIVLCDINEFSIFEQSAIFLIWPLAVICVAVIFKSIPKKNEVAIREKTTQQEIDQTPNWATHYFIDIFDNVIYLRKQDISAYDKLDFITIKPIGE